MIQEILIGLIFITAVGYIGRLIYKSFTSPEACSTGCGKCSVVTDFKKLEQFPKPRV